MVARSRTAETPRLGLHLVLGADFPEMVRNFRRSLEVYIRTGGTLGLRQLDSCKCLKTIAGTSGIVRDGALTVRILTNYKAAF